MDELEEREIELSNRDWCRIKKRLMSMPVDEALKEYEPPVKLTHGGEYITYWKGEE